MGIPKKLRRRHKEFLANQNLNHKEFLFLGESAECYKFYHKSKRKEVDIRR